MDERFLEVRREPNSRIFGLVGYGEMILMYCVAKQIGVWDEIGFARFLSKCQHELQAIEPGSISI